MTNAEKFVHLFGLYATELWSKSEKDFLIWLNAEYENIHDANVGELIDRQAAIDLVRDVCDAVMSGCESWYDPETEDEVYKDIREVDAILKCNKEVRIALRNMPSTQPERKRGEWIKDIERFGDNVYHCDQCGAVLEKDDLEWRNNYYCYHCGAKMEDNKDE